MSTRWQLTVVALCMLLAASAAGRTQPNIVVMLADDFGYGGTMDAFMRGVTDGLGLYLNIIASLIAFIAAVALINMMLGAAPDVAGAPLTLERFASSPMIAAPNTVITCIGVPMPINAGFSTKKNGTK